MIPKKIFFTKGIGKSKDKIISFELALRDAGIEKFNLVPVSSIFPPNCEWVLLEEGLKYLKPGEIVYCVMARTDTNKDEEISASIGVAVPENKNFHGYISEHNSSGKDCENLGRHAEDLAGKMLRTSLRDCSGAKNITQLGKGRKKIWTTAVAVAVFADYD